jgi:hypothetical protein
MASFGIAFANVNGDISGLNISSPIGRDVEPRRQRALLAKRNRDLRVSARAFGEDRRRERRPTVILSQ